MEVGSNLMKLILENISLSLSHYGIYSILRPVPIYPNVDINR